MSKIVNINANKPPVVYTVTIIHHYDGTLEFNIADVADDERSREAVLDAFRRICGADEQINRLTKSLKMAVFTESEYVKTIEKEGEKLRAELAAARMENTVLFGTSHHEICKTGKDEIAELRAAYAAVRNATLDEAVVAANNMRIASTNERWALVADLRTDRTIEAIRALKDGGGDE